MSKPSLTYREAGVNIGAADAFAATIRTLAQATHSAAVRPSGDAYAGLFRPPIAGLAAPLLAATCDGVGTKLLVARACNSYRGIGQDLVAMNVNDLLPRGARPLFFLDYIAVGTLASVPLTELAEGIAAACAAVGCALLGGETAEMPDLYARGDCDLAGFAVGIVDEAQVPTEELNAGDVVLGLPASGIHANGFSLARRAFQQAGVEYQTYFPELGRTLGEELLVPTQLYVQPVLALMAKVRVKAAAHITGGGLLGRASKLGRGGRRVLLDPDAYARQPIFELIARLGGVSAQEMACTFNMGLGFLAVVSAADADAWLGGDGAGGPWQKVGRIAAGKDGAELGYAAA